MRSINIYPESFINRPAKVLFDTNEEKETYIKNEWNYCLKTYNDFLTANNSEKEKKKNDLMKCRVQFARKVGYSPQKTNKYVWIKTKQEEPESIA